MSEGWQSVASLPPLEAGEVQIWRIDLASATESLDAYGKHLSQDELDRSDRFRASQVRMQFVAARACLRILLGNILGLPPNEVPITLSAYGKPEAAPSHGHPIFFNLAHSRDMVVIALCRESQVGIDLEYLDRETDVLEIARRTFTEEECHQIETAGDREQQKRAFFRCWTRKEAVVKADGRGLSLPLTAFEVPVMTAAHSVRVEIAVEHRPNPGPGTWFVSDLALSGEIAGAYAVALAQLRLRTLTFPLALLRQADSKG